VEAESVKFPHGFVRFLQGVSLGGGQYLGAFSVEASELLYRRQVVNFLDSFDLVNQLNLHHLFLSKCTTNDQMNDVIVALLGSASRRMFLSDPKGATEEDRS
jgi:hypothetical protein